MAHSSLTWLPLRPPEDEDMAEHRIVFQRRLYLCGETIEAVAHVGDTGNQPDFGASW